MRYPSQLLFISMFANVCADLMILQIKIHQFANNIFIKLLLLKLGSYLI